MIESGRSQPSNAPRIAQCSARGVASTKCCAGDTLATLSGQVRLREFEPPSRRGRRDQREKRVGGSHVATRSDEFPEIEPPSRRGHRDQKEILGARTPPLFAVPSAPTVELRQPKSPSL